MNMAAITAEERTHEQKLDLLAEVAVRVGLGLRTGQELLMTASIGRSAAGKAHYGAGLPRGRFAGDDALQRR